jgi:hypothetical protein
MVRQQVMLVAAQSPVDLIIKCQALKYLARISDTINNIVSLK